MLFLLSLLFSLTFAAIPTFTLKNSAVAGMTMPAIGLGTGGYGRSANGYGSYPECNNEASGCGPYVIQAVSDWLAAGGRRLDCANSYDNQKSIQQAIQKSGVPRSELFILTKVGPTYPLGYNDTIKQIEDTLNDFNTTYVDLTLIHWPVQDPNSVPVGNTTDPACMNGQPTYNEEVCRLNTWVALLSLFAAGKTRAIGVSNYNISHLQEIINASLPLPAYNQCPFHLYRSSTQQSLRNFCKANNILFGGYSPLGIPDWHTFPGPYMSTSPIKDPVVGQIAKAHGVSPAQVLVQWEYALGVPINPRSQNLPHMNENLNSYNFTLTPEEINNLLAAPQDWCTIDPDMYECAPDAALKRAEWFGFGK